MPFYEYAPIKTCLGTCGGRFSVLQKLSDPEINSCNECAAPCKKLISAPAVQTGSAHRMSQSHLEKHGFTQYKRSEKGVYEKTAGLGPDKITEK
jgi:putative FmdB family regulatory protein